MQCKYFNKMKLIKSCIPILLFTSSICFQAFSQQINGVLKAFGKEKLSTSGIEINSFGANPKYTNSNGMFSLSFVGKEPGDKIELLIGETNELGDSIEVLNFNEIDNIYLPIKGSHQIIEVLICKKRETEKALKSYYKKKLNQQFIPLNELTSNVANTKVKVESVFGEKVYLEKEIFSINNKLEIIRGQLLNKPFSDNEQDSLKNTIKTLIEEKENTKIKLNAQEKLIANLIKNEISSIRKKALVLINQNAPIDTVLALISDDKLNAIQDSILVSKNKIDNDIEELLKTYKLKIELLESLDKYMDIIVYRQKIISIINNFNFNKFNKLQAIEKLSSAYNDYGMNREALLEIERGLKYYSDSIQSGLKNNFEYLIPFITLKSIKQLYEVPNADDIETNYSLTLSALNEFKNILLDETHYDDEIPESTMAFDYFIKLIELAKCSDLREYRDEINRDCGYIAEELIGILLEFKSSSKEKIFSKFDSLSILNSQYLIYNLACNDYNSEISLEIKKLLVNIEDSIPKSKYEILYDSYKNISIQNIITNDYDESEDYALKASKILEKQTKESTLTTAKTYDLLSEINDYKNDFETSLMWKFKAHKIRRDLLYFNHLDISYDYYDIGFIYTQLRNYQTAINYFHKSVDVIISGELKNYLFLSDIYSELAYCYKEQNSKKEFKKYKRLSRKYKNYK